MKKNMSMKIAIPVGGRPDDFPFRYAFWICRK